MATLSPNKMVNIPKIVLKSQTRLTLNERFTQFAEQQEARLQMLKNDLRTRLVEESYENGSHDSAELSEKLDELTRDIDNPERRATLLSKKKHRPKENRRAHDPQGAREEPIVPAYRSLLYDSGERNDRVRKQRRKDSRLVTYGDVLSGDNGEGEVSHWRAEALRGVKPAHFPYQTKQKYVNPLMRDSDDETTGGEGGASGAPVHSRLGVKQSGRLKGGVHKNRPIAASSRRGGEKLSKHVGGSSATRHAVTKEDLDRELDEYRQRGSVMDVEMGED
ncbi:uncharacterized protein LOC100898208 [Galendromus occidentalis]|uniref:Uncharacterized protein LOC100898208 n=1 Tax=Galendromus occidentalis TaxID=34638 RepID=A0AAJ6QPL9_9ACAR|nr:uncharacterized protein LOC100898208 [Galendromus occidentalis]